MVGVASVVGLDGRQHRVVQHALVIVVCIRELLLFPLLLGLLLAQPRRLLHLGEDNGAARRAVHGQTVERVAPVLLYEQPFSVLNINHFVLWQTAENGCRRP